MFETLILVTKPAVKLLAFAVIAYVGLVFKDRKKESL